MRSELFAQDHFERPSQERWTRQSDRMLRVGLGPDVVATKGAMVAYQGGMAFRHEGSGSVGKLMKKMLTSEDAPMMRVSGEGEVFFARQARHVFTVLLEGEAITVGSASLLAFDDTLSWDIRRVGGAGLMAGGLFNLELSGHGVLALCSDGPPMILDCSVRPTYVDPQAAVAWSANLVPGIRNDLSMGSLLRGGSGEAFQLAFSGPGFVVVQPSEGVPAVRQG
ncbi:AIM24 family protein [uncultured Kocuria sp.]|uniref:AIM24 family protein n=1 Tax=uncultured Kocuria sp. TaxID=259305 RepID=UPI0026145838|nr:AIM24 family protein [uncultured Kocuria sp.]